MIYEKEIFERATLKGLSDYLLYSKRYSNSTRSYDERLDDAYQQFEAVAKKHAGDHSDTLNDAINDLVRETSEIYMEIGIASGISMILDIIKKQNT